MSFNDEIRHNRQCQACEKSIDPSDLASMQCGHTFHYQCLQILLGEQITAKIFPVCCPISECNVEPSMYFMSVVLDDPEFEKYIILEKQSIQSFQIYECHTCSSSFLAYPTSKIHKCLKCSNTICLGCSEIIHPGKICKSNIIKTCANHFEVTSPNENNILIKASPLVSRRLPLKLASSQVSISNISTSSNTPAGQSSASLKPMQFAKIGSKKILPTSFLQAGAFDSSVKNITSDQIMNILKETNKGFASLSKQIPPFKIQSQNQQKKFENSSSSSSQSSISGAQQIASEEKEGIKRNPEIRQTISGINVSRRAFSSCQIEVNQ